MRAESEISQRAAAAVSTLKQSKDGIIAPIKLRRRRQRLNPRRVKQVS
jgi:hypothetical protein